MKTVAIVGLGAIGAGAALALARSKKFELTGYDVRSEVFGELGGAVRGAASPAAASEGAEVALVAVMNDAQVRDVLTGPGGILTAAKPPRAIAILSTVTLPTIFWAAEEAAKRKVALVDCGVSGGSQAMKEAATTAMLGGDDEAIALARPVIEGFSNPVVHCGVLGNGMRAKLARNLIIYTDWVTAWEGARLALAAGVPLDKFVECVTASDKWVRPHMALVEQGTGLQAPQGPEARNGSRTAAFADKDLRAALALGADLGVDLPAAELALRRFPAAAGLE